jgi:peroxiredoxin
VRHPIALLLSAALFAGPVFAAVIPRPAPEFAIDMQNGAKLDLSQYRGKVIALEFLLTGCPHCQQCARTLSKLNKEYAAKGLQPVGAAINADAALQLKSFIEQQGVNYPIGMVQQEKAHDFLQHSVMMVMQMPQLVFIDRKGNIRAQYGGTSPFFTDEERNMRNAIEELLKEPAGNAPALSTKKGKK